MPPHQPHSFDAGAALYNAFTAIMTEVVNNARKSVKQKGGDPAETGNYLIWGGWIAIWFGIMANFQGTLLSLGQVFDFIFISVTNTDVVDCYNSRSLYATRFLENLGSDL
ncbi:hypothetical protein BCR33DRAFT_714630 [Rhizoclosmatium globosum]|uniref:Uncharacterized protein n=1 Tax=Rhizoclosmatium globosum TaxID=329046 RepID=A0A1Y2CMJ5_9FUNG|nr:hypothetical protein BCR33DRAFT_714630 [Rhizoclosmatium globosum]|eukprot:ORY48232.1 hypothetical protein BCR33DRAFT_714630 [Rhizoclosmatium globosum]